MYLSKKTWIFLHNVYLQRQYKKFTYLKFEFETRGNVCYSFLKFPEWVRHDGRQTKIYKKNRRSVGAKYGKLRLLHGSTR